MAAFGKINRAWRVALVLALTLSAFATIAEAKPPRNVALPSWSAPAPACLDTRVGTNSRCSALSQQCQCPPQSYCPTAAGGFNAPSYVPPNPGGTWNLNSPTWSDFFNASAMPPSLTLQCCGNQPICPSGSKLAGSRLPSDSNCNPADVCMPAATGKRTVVTVSYTNSPSASPQAPIAAACPSGQHLETTANGGSKICVKDTATKSTGRITFMGGWFCAGIAPANGSIPYDHCGGPVRENDPRGYSGNTGSVPGAYPSNPRNISFGECGYLAESGDMTYSAAGANCSGAVAGDAATISQTRPSGQQRQFTSVIFQKTNLLQYTTWKQIGYDVCKPGTGDPSVDSGCDGTTQIFTPQNGDPTRLHSADDPTGNNNSHDNFGGTAPMCGSDVARGWQTTAEQIIASQGGSTSGSGVGNVCQSICGYETAGYGGWYTNAGRTCWQYWRLVPGD